MRVFWLSCLEYIILKLPYAIRRIGAKKRWVSQTSAAATEAALGWRGIKFLPCLTAPRIIAQPKKTAKNMDLATSKFEIRAELTSMLVPFIGTKKM